MPQYFAVGSNISTCHKPNCVEILVETFVFYTIFDLVKIKGILT